MRCAQHTHAALMSPYVRPARRCRVGVNPFGGSVGERWPATSKVRQGAWRSAAGKNEVVPPCGARGGGMSGKTLAILLSAFRVASERDGRTRRECASETDGRVESV